MLAILLCALVAATSASHTDAPSLRQLRPRQAGTVDDAPTLTTSSGSTVTGEPIPYCSSVFESFITEIPVIPTEALEFSEKYYETAARTAIQTLSDCAWVPAIPESLDGPFYEYFEELVEFFDDFDTIMDQATLSRCDNINWSRTDDPVSVCVEFDEYVEGLEERHDSDAGGAAGEDGGSAAGRMSAACPFAAVVLLVGVAILW